MAGLQSVPDIMERKLDGSYNDNSKYPMLLLKIPLEKYLFETF